MMQPKVCGLARALSKMGYCSRSQASLLIQAKHVCVNGGIVQDPELPVRIPQDRIEVDGSPVEKRTPIYLAMNKPRGVVTTACDEKGRETIYDLLERASPGKDTPWKDTPWKDTPWVGPVGRLDKASEGLLLLTNDSEWAARITDPASHLDKVYHVQIDRVADDDLLAKMRKGCTRDDGQDCLRAKHARLLRHGDRNSWLEITLDEGKNRQIRRLLEALGVRVLRLVRVSIGPLQLRDLKKGAVRPLAAAEKRAIDRALRS